MSNEIQNPNASENNAGQANGGFNPDIERLLDVNMAISIEIGRTQIKLQELLNLSKGAIIELDKLSGEPLDIYANGKLIAHGDVISVNGKYGVRLTSVHSQTGKKTENPQS